jgi:Xaa-Pro aminopeptidase
LKQDLDRLVREAGLAAVLVLGDAAHNPPMYYLTGGGHISDAALFMKPGEPPTLYCHAMEREEAAKSGLRVVPLPKGGVTTLAQAPGSILSEQGLKAGKIGVYGILDSGNLISIMDSIRSACPDLEVTGEPKEDSIFLRAMETKDQDEIAQIRHMGAVTTEVVRLVADYLTSRDVGPDEALLGQDGRLLTIGDVKRKIALWLAERGAEQPEGCIFAIGKDAGVPHSVGEDDDVIRVGRTIVFDIFPAQAGGGYFYDFTRTWSLGYASEDAQLLFDEVKDVYEKIVQNLDLNVSFKEYQKLACSEFAAKGHATPMDGEGVMLSGYVHSLGHGVGLNVHERPWSRHTAADENLLRPGVVVTIEPGLYYPERGMGARIEDTYWVRPDGEMERLADYPYTFVLPMKNWSPKGTKAQRG